MRSTLLQRAARCDAGFEQLCVTVMNPQLGFYGLPFLRAVPSLYRSSSRIARDPNTGVRGERTTVYDLSAPARRLAVHGTGDTDWSHLGDRADDGVARPALALRLASLTDLRVTQVRYAQGSARLAEVTWHARVAYTKAYRRWFAQLPIRASYGVDAVRYHVREGTGAVRTGFSRTDGGWRYDPAVLGDAAFSLSRSQLLTDDAAIVLFVLALVVVSVLLTMYAPWLVFAAATLVARDMRE